MRNVEINWYSRFKGLFVTCYLFLSAANAIPVLSVEKKDRWKNLFVCMDRLEEENKFVLVYERYLREKFYNSLSDRAIRYNEIEYLMPVKVLNDIYSIYYEFEQENFLIPDYLNEYLISIDIDLQVLKGEFNIENDDVGQFKGLLDTLYKEMHKVFDLESQYLQEHFLEPGIFSRISYMPTGSNVGKTHSPYRYIVNIETVGDVEYQLVFARQRKRDCPGRPCLSPVPPISASFIVLESGEKVTITDKESYNSGIGERLTLVSDYKGKITSDVLVARVISKIIDRSVETISTFRDLTRENPDLKYSLESAKSFYQVLSGQIHQVHRECDSLLGKEYPEVNRSFLNAGRVLEKFKIEDKKYFKKK